MTRKPRKKDKSKSAKRPVSAKKSAARRSVKSAKRTAKPDTLDDFIVTAAKALNLPAKKAWLPAIKANLRVTLQHATTVAAFELPDDAEPAPVFRA